LLDAILVMVRPGDEVILLEPAYDSYAPAVELAGGRSVGVALDPARGFRVDWDRVRDAITPRTRLLVVNTPHNPTGSCWEASDLASLREIVAGSPILLLSDEVYEHIVFDGRAHQSVSSDPELARRAFVVSSFGKTFHCTGWKVGYCCAPDALMAEFRKVHQFDVFTVNHPVQRAIARYLADPAHYLGLAAFYQERRDRFLAGLANTRFRALPCAGTYFVLVAYDAISDAPDTEFARRLATKHGVASIPLSPFYPDPGRAPRGARLIRFCFGKKPATLDAALERLACV
jgi:methionine aminotransferase